MTFHFDVERENLFNTFQIDAIALAKKEGYRITPELIDTVQTDLAIKAGVTPPHWTGFVYCENCGIVAAESHLLGSKVSKCNFCFLDFEPETAPSHHPRIVAIKNRLNFYISRVKENPPPEIDMSGYKSLLDSKLRILRP